MLGFVALCACSQQAASSGETPPPVSAATPNAPGAGADSPSNAEGTKIGTIVTHDHKVSILGRQGDLRVVVRKLDGTMVADGLSLDELRAENPEIHQIVTSAVASGKAKGTFIDATLDRGERPTAPREDTDGVKGGPAGPGGLGGPRR